MKLVFNHRRQIMALSKKGYYKLKKERDQALTIMLKSIFKDIKAKTEESK